MDICSKTAFAGYDRAAAYISGIAHMHSQANLTACTRSSQVNLSMDRRVLEVPTLATGNWWLLGESKFSSDIAPEKLTMLK